MRREEEEEEGRSGEGEERREEEEEGGTGFRIGGAFGKREGRERERDENEINHKKSG